MLEKRGDKKKNKLVVCIVACQKYILPISPKLNQATIAKTKYFNITGCHLPKLF